MVSEASDTVSVALCGSGGSGVMTAANMLVDAAAAAGWYALFSRSSGPQIRGGEAAAVVRLSTRPIDAVDDTTHILLAIDWLNAQRFAAELPLAPDSLILTDPAAGDVPEAMARAGAKVVALPMKDLAKEIDGGRANMVALGALAALIGLPVALVTDVLGASLKKKHADALAPSIAAVRRGAEAAAAIGGGRRLGDGASGPRWALTGNQAAGLGAIRGGIRFCAAYPITPASEILEWLSGALPAAGGVFVQAEDELASINMCVGASFGGVPSLTATSGPGLALMTEGLGLAVASETPVVVIDVQRGGPSTGIPTKSEQADLDIAVHGLHGDAPHVVVAPQSIGDCLFTTQWAVHLAETLQVPAIMLSDQSLGQARAIIDAPPRVTLDTVRRTAEAGAGPYRRYAVTADGVSPMALPGTPGRQYTADGLEHAESGTPSSQAADHAAQMDKRLRKLTGFDYGDAWAAIEGNGPLAVLTWGSCTGAAREAVARAATEGLAVRLVAPRLLSPARPDAMAAALKGVTAALVVEMSHGAQFLRLLRADYDLPPVVEVLHRPGPLPIRPGEILSRLRNLGGAR